MIQLISRTDQGNQERLVYPIAASLSHAIRGFTCLKFRTHFLRCKSGKIGECDTLSPGRLTRASPVSQSVSAKLRPSSLRWLRGRLDMISKLIRSMCP